ncbi:MAG: dockerin type I repeat-containing protein [Acutalibacteraceae bacterium]|nr:dockerin type I repeat-containing protein [Acutalibacteraceae bacterium]
MLKHLNKPPIFLTFLQVLVILCPVFTVSAFLFAFSDTAQACSSYQLNGFNSNTAMHCDNKGVYITSFSGKSLEIDYITDNNITKRTLQLNSEIKYVTTNNGIVYAISTNKNTIYLNQYFYNNDTLNCFIIEADYINSKYKFAVAGNRLYFAENEDYSQIACHSITGEKLYSFYANEVIDYRTDNNDILYIFSRNNIYTIDTACNSQPQCKLSNINIRGDVFICDNTAFDCNGNAINLQNGLIVATNIISYKPNLAVINGYYCKYSQGNIYGYTENGTESILFSIDAGANAQLCSFNDKLYILSEAKELFIASENELDFPQNSTSPPTAYSTNPITNSNQNSNNNQPDSGNNQSYSFSINNYYIDKDSNIIWNIPDNTTIATFENSITHCGYTLDFYNANNVKKTNGKIGTGFTMVVKDTSAEHSRYSISVKGDLSGDGTINQNDVTMLSDYLMSSTTLTKEQYTSADSNGDNIINGVDILKIAKNNL